MRIRFRCACPASDVDIEKQQPKCPRCGETRVKRRLDRTAPRFVGHGRGPLVTSKALEAVPVNLAPKGALKVRPPRKDAHARSV